MTLAIRTIHTPGQIDLALAPRKKRAARLQHESIVFDILSPQHVGSNMLAHSPKEPQVDFHVRMAAGSRSAVLVDAIHRCYEMLKLRKSDLL